MAVDVEKLIVDDENEWFENEGIPLDSLTELEQSHFQFMLIDMKRKCAHKHALLSAGEELLICFLLRSLMPPDNAIPPFYDRKEFIKKMGAEASKKGFDKASAE